MNIRQALFTLCFLTSTLVFGQGVDGFRLNARMAVAVPIGDMADDGETALNNGLATPGVDFNAGVEIFLTEVIDVGARVGYTVMPVDDKAFNDHFQDVWGFDPETNTTSYQNIYFMGGGGLNLSVIEDKFDVQPYMYAGLGIFKSAGKEASGTYESETFYYSNEANYQPALQLQPGLSLNWYLNDFAEFQFFSEYNHSSIQVEETVQNGSGAVPENVDVDYSLSGVHVGAGLTFRF